MTSTTRSITRLRPRLCESLFCLLANAGSDTCGYSLSNDLTLRLTGALVMAVSAFVFVGLNVTRLRLSRDLLDAYLLKAQRKIRQQDASETSIVLRNAAATDRACSDSSARCDDSGAAADD